MKKNLISLMALISLAACGGGGGGGDSSTTPSTNSNTSSSTNSSSNATVRSRLDACPVIATSTSSESGRCLAGSYDGTDAFSKEAKEACTVKTEADGTTVATRGSTTISVEKPFLSFQYTKNTYSVISGTSPIGYSLNWAAVNDKSQSVFFQFNANYDGKLTIEVKDRNSGTSISCQLPV